MKWLGPWTLNEVWTTGLPEDDPATLDEHGGYSEMRWIRWYEEPAHCERCSPRQHVAIGPSAPSLRSSLRNPQEEAQP